MYKTTGIKYKLMPLKFFLYLSEILFKLFFKRLQTVKTEQQPFWEMTQAAAAEHQIITHLGPVKSLKEIEGPSEQLLDKYQKSETERTEFLIYNQKTM